MVKRKYCKQPSIVEQLIPELQKLIKALFIESVAHPTWLANLVPVVKKNGYIRICGACPKDEFPLPPKNGI
jgi:hypothetical protein